MTDAAHQQSLLRNELQRSYKNRGIIAAPIIGVPVVGVALGFQIWLFTTNVPMASAYMSIGIAYTAAIFLYVTFYTPFTTVAMFSKSLDSIHVVYNLFCKRKVERKEKLSNVEDLELETVKSQYGIAGYYIKFTFKDGTKPLFLFHENNPQVLASINELSQFCLGRNANADLGSNCDGKCGSSHCFCCPGYKLKIAIWTVVALAYIAGSFALAIVLNGRLDKE